MVLFRVHAYAVEPQRTAGDTRPPEGGAVAVNADIRAALEQAARASRLETRTLIDFNVDQDTRTCETRDLIMRFSFRGPAEARAAAVNLATRLSEAMDLRSTPCLFIAAAEREGTNRRTTLWTFPRDEAFQFRGGRTTASIRLLTDIFSRTSRLRKAALFEGRQRRADFLSGRVLDFQAATSSRVAADFWISRFLGALFSIQGDAGTRLLASCLRRAYDNAQTQQPKEDLYAATVAVRRSPRRRWSLRDFADNYLGREARALFLDSAPNEETISSTFEFRRETFDRTLNFRIFHLDTDVWVSAPIRQIGRSVTLSENDSRLSCEGRIVEDMLRTRRG